MKWGHKHNWITVSRETFHSDPVWKVRVIWQWCDRCGVIRGLGKIPSN